MTAPPPVISVRGARYVYPHGNVTALDGVSVDVVRGSVVGVVGQNGSGKTTLTKLLNGLLKPTSGSVVVDGQDTVAHSVQDLARSIGYVFQNPNHQLFAPTVTDELAFGPRNIGYSSDEVADRVAEAVDLFDLDGVLALHPYRLPYPLRKLVSIASVLTMRPTVLILDEPTTGQDHRTTTTIERLVRGLGQRGVTVICVSHDMPLIAAVAERVIVLHDGRLVGDGSPRDIFTDPATMLLARLTPPQITRLSMRMSGRVGRPGVLSVAELVAEVRSTDPGDDDHVGVA